MAFSATCLSLAARIADAKSSGDVATIPPPRSIGFIRVLVCGKTWPRGIMWKIVAVGVIMARQGYRQIESGEIGKGPVGTEVRFHQDILHGGVAWKRSPQVIFFPFLLQFPILAAVMDVSIPWRPSSP